MTDEINQIRDARPRVLPPSPRLVETERSRLMAHIRDHHDPAREIASRKTGRSRRWAIPLAVVTVLGTAAAGWEALRGGNLDFPPFSGESWELIVGEETNGDGTYKVCYRFQSPNETPNDGNGLGRGGCTTSPDVSRTDRVILEVQSALQTPNGTVIFIGLSQQRVAKLIVTADGGSAVEVAPFAMPQSGKQLAAVELLGPATSVRVEALDDQGTVLETQVLSDLNIQ